VSKGEAYLFIAAGYLSSNATTRANRKKVAHSRHLLRGVDKLIYFYNTGNMETSNIVQALFALAQETRLGIFRLLVVAGPTGMSVGKIAETLNLANATLSFHLKELTSAGLTTATQSGRSINYAANFTTMNSLLAYLTENCCAGAACAPECTSGVCTPPKKPTLPSSRKRRKS
jgi:ArsR family transcriptional regulator, arsenate/arsenite/antimonite-responsive transcriptional repressor